MRLSASARFTPRNDLGQFIDVVIRPGVEASVQAACELIQQTAQSYAPVETGALRDSITVSLNDTGKTIVGTVSANVPYAGYVEYGTGRRGQDSAEAGPYPYKESWPGMTPRPFMRPALDESRGAVLDLFRANISLGM